LPGSQHEGSIVRISRHIRYFIAELRRRKVFRAVTFYAITAWVVLQVAEVTFEPLGFPPWAMRAIVIAAIVGLPVSFLLAWVVGSGEKGLVLDLPLWAEDQAQVAPRNKADLWYTGLMLAVVFGVGYSAMLLLSNDASEAGPDEATEAVPPVALGVPRNSIAVLPFRNFDGQEETDFFALGLGEEILNLLASMRELDVAARTSSFQFRDDPVDVRDIAQRLTVSYILEGSARRSEDRIRVHVQLVDGANGYQVFGKVYDRPLTDIFSIQQEIAAAVANELQIALSVDSEKQLQQTPTDDLNAYIFYLHGKERLGSSDDSDVMATAIRLFSQAIELDPEFSRAYSGICEAHLRLYEIGNDTADFQQARAACERAIELDAGRNSEPYLAMGTLYRFRGQGWGELAEQMLEQAVRIAPTSPDGYIELGELRLMQKRMDEAEGYFLRAIDLKRNYWKAHTALAGFHYSNERYRQAVDGYEIATRLAPDVASAHAGKGAAYTMLGEFDQARAAYDRSLELKPSRQAYTNIGLSYYYAGKFADAAEMQRKALGFAPDDHRVWGRLAESYRFVPGREAEAAQAYQRAAELAEQNLQINDSDWRTRGLLAIYLAHSGRPDAALKNADSALEKSRGSPEALYYLALVVLNAGDQERALQALEDAVAADAQYRQLIESDPDLAALRGLERFDRLIDPPSEPQLAPRIEP
jgi:TolB-like protein/Flp pilus assembly protein TadD